MSRVISVRKVIIMRRERVIYNSERERESVRIWVFLIMFASASSLGEQFVYFYNGFKCFLYMFGVAFVKMTYKVVFRLGTEPEGVDNGSFKSSVKRATKCIGAGAP